MRSARVKCPCEVCGDCALYGRCCNSACIPVVVCCASFAVHRHAAISVLTLVQSSAKTLIWSHFTDALYFADRARALSLSIPFSFSFSFSLFSTFAICRCLPDTSRRSWCGPRAKLTTVSTRCFYPGPVGCACGFRPFWVPDAFFLSRCGSRDAPLWCGVDSHRCRWIAWPPAPCRASSMWC